MLGLIPHKIEAVFLLGSRGFYGLGLWEVKMLWVQVMGVTLVKRKLESGDKKECCGIGVQAGDQCRKGSSFSDFKLTLARGDNAGTQDRVGLSPKFEVTVIMLTLILQSPPWQAHWLHLVVERCYSVQEHQRKVIDLHFVRDGANI